MSKHRWQDIKDKGRTPIYLETLVSYLQVTQCCECCGQPIRRERVPDTDERFLHEQQVAITELKIGLRKMLEEEGITDYRINIYATETPHGIRLRAMAMHKHGGTKMYWVPS